MDECSASVHAAHAAPARVIEHVAPVPVDGHIIPVQAHAIGAEFRSFIRSLALETPTAPVPMDERIAPAPEVRSAPDLVVELEEVPYRIRLRRKKKRRQNQPPRKPSTNNKSVDGLRHGNRLPGAVQKFRARCRLALPRSFRRARVRYCNTSSHPRGSCSRGRVRLYRNCCLIRSTCSCGRVHYSSTDCGICGISDHYDDGHISVLLFNVVAHHVRRQGDPWKNMPVSSSRSSTERGCNPP